MLHNFISYFTLIKDIQVALVLHKQQQNVLVDVHIYQEHYIQALYLTIVLNILNSD